MRLLLNRLLKIPTITPFVLLCLILIPTGSNSKAYPFSPFDITAGHQPRHEGKMFLIAVIDSDDKIIGERCSTDLISVTAAFEEMADWLMIDMEEPKIINGSNFSKEAVNDAIDNWLPAQQPGKNDIVIFYYSGHGFRLPDDASNFPRMWLKTADDQKIESTNLRMKEDVYDRIIQIGAGVNLVLSDCCNTTAAGDNVNFDNVTVPTRAKVIHKRKHTSEDSDEDDNAEKLFIPGHPFSLLVSAADKGEFAGGKAETGGFFTYYLLEGLIKCTYDGQLDASWESILKYTDEKAAFWARSAECPTAKHTEKGRCVQTVEFTIDNADN